MADKKERVVDIPSFLDRDTTVDTDKKDHPSEEASEPEKAKSKVEDGTGAEVETEKEAVTDASADDDDGWITPGEENTEQKGDESADGEAKVTTDQENDERRSIYDMMEQDIMASDLPDAEKARRLSYLIKIRSKKVNIMLAGATGSGKSSTVNALFNMEVAEVGVGVDPETMDIEKYELDNLTIWDTPGLGDGVENDERIRKQIVRKLSELDDEGRPLIDMVVVILDASSKDLGTSYDLINEVLIPSMEKDAGKRILVGLNQSDIAMKGKHWDAEKNEPDEVLLDFLEKKVESVKNRIKEATGLDIMPIYYCAGYKEEGGEQCKPYNLTKLLFHIVKSIPRDKRLALADNINPDKDNWLYDDKESDYKGGIKSGFLDTVWYGISDGAETGSEIGQGILGIPGFVVGGAIGAVVGAVGGFFSAIFG